MSYGKGAKGRATRLHSLVVRSRRVCENCGETDYSQLQAAHVVSRKYNATRSDENAAFALCARCHRRFTDWPLEWAEFVIQKLGEEQYDAIRRKAEAGVKSNDLFWEAECARLKSLLEAVVVCEGESR